MTTLKTIVKTCSGQISPKKCNKKVPKVKFALEDTTFVIPIVDESMISNLWWSSNEMTRFRHRQAIQRTIENNAPDMTLVITNNPSRRKALAATTEGFQQPKAKFVSCGHDKVHKALSLMNLKFQHIVIDGGDVHEYKCTENLVRKLCPEATILVIHMDASDNITLVQSC